MNIILKLISYQPKVAVLSFIQVVQRKTEKSEGRVVLCKKKILRASIHLLPTYRVLSLILLDYVEISFAGPLIFRGKSTSFVVQTGLVVLGLLAF